MVQYRSIQNLKVLNDFYCENYSKIFNSVCHNCDYYFKDSNGLPKCLQQNIRDWAEYHIEENEE